jgi:molybdopterin-synthase adenylyltransferase
MGKHRGASRNAKARRGAGDRPAKSHPAQRFDADSGGFVEVRFPARIGRELTIDLSRPPSVGYERAALGRISWTTGAEYDTILLAGIRSIPDSEYRVTAEGTAWSGKFAAEVISECSRSGMGLALIHEHSISTHPGLSPVDVESFERLLPRLRLLLPNRPHASIVLGQGGSAGGLACLPREGRPSTKTISRARWIESPLSIVPPPPDSRESRFEIYDRQDLLIGRLGQRILGRSSVGIVGVGGGGTHVAQQCAYIGVGRIVLVDQDLIEPSNLSRMVGVGPSDVGRQKVDAVADHLLRINPACRVLPLRSTFPSDASLAELKTCDLVVGCVDSLQARSEIQKFSWRYLVPEIDVGIGTGVTPSVEARRVEAIAGHVHVYLPGGPCMWCTGLLSSEKLAIESGGQGPAYVVGVAAPQVVSLNGVVGSMAVTETVQLLTGFISRAGGPKFWQLDLALGRTYEVLIKADQVCNHAGTELGAGDPS